MTAEDLEQVRRVVAEVLAQSLADLVRQAQCRVAGAAVDQQELEQAATLTVGQAVRRYGKGRARIVELFEAGAVRGRWIKGRGRSGRELTLNRADLDRALGVAG